MLTRQLNGHVAIHDWIAILRSTAQLGIVGPAWRADSHVTSRELPVLRELHRVLNGDAVLERVGSDQADVFPERNAGLTIADLCTGCGCVAVAVAHERPAATVVASDISSAALEVARRNADRHGVGRRVSFRTGDLVRGLDTVERPFDAILANPPYVVDRARPALQPEVRDFEPALALFGGSDGLEVITRLVAEAPRKLRPGGYLVFEFGLGQDVEIEELVDRAPELTLVGVRRDLQGISRTAIAQRV